MEIELLEYDAQQNTLTLSVSAQNQPALQAFVNQTSENLILPYSLFQQPNRMPP